MAITNQVTRADTGVGRAARPARLLAQPASPGTGIGVAVIDSGIAPHNALGSRVVARVNLVSDEPGVTGDPFGHGTHVAGIIGGNATAATRVTPAFAGGSAPGVQFIDVRVLGRNGIGYTSDVIAGIDWAIANRTELRHPRHQPLARTPGRRTGRDRSAVPRRRARRHRPASSSSPRPATTA